MTKGRENGAGYCPLQAGTVRAAQVTDLDPQRTPDQLLVEAFGPSEGGLVFRNGGEAIELIEREIVGYREELSNPAP